MAPSATLSPKPSAAISRSIDRFTGVAPPHGQRRRPLLVCSAVMQTARSVGRRQWLGRLDLEGFLADRQRTLAALGAEHLEADRFLGVPLADLGARAVP